MVPERILTSGRTLVKSLCIRYTFYTKKNIKKGEFFLEMGKKKNSKKKEYLKNKSNNHEFIKDKNRSR